MRYLLDTHTLYWALFEPKNLDPRVQTLIQESDSTFCVSTTSLWEIEIKRHKRPQSLNCTGAEIFKACEGAGFEILPVKPEHALSVGDFIAQEIHNDPFDHLLLATAKVEQLILLTHDATLAKYKGVLVEIY